MKENNTSTNSVPVDNDIQLVVDMKPAVNHVTFAPPLAVTYSPEVGCSSSSSAHPPPFPHPPEVVSVSSNTQHFTQWPRSDDKCPPSHQVVTTGHDDLLYAHRVSSDLQPTNALKIESDFRRRWRKTPKKTVCISSTMLFAGLTFLFTGLICIGACDQTSRGFAYFGIGALLLIPGTYSAFILISYWRGRHGYSPDQLPQFD
jgi:hypothetical protein